MSRRGRQPSAEDVLRGRASVDVHGLVALIHSVNPTGRGRRGPDEARAYATKAALQSLLLRRFAEHVRFEESAPGVIALSLRDTGQHAAHCPLEALDEDVRARVRFELDTGDASDAAPAGVRASRAEPSWADRTRLALERYDYEEAEAVLRAACRERPTDAAPAVALLELLVDHLGNPPAVLELFGTLDPSLRGDRRIAGAVAVAAALFGDVPLARERLLEVRGERAAEAWAHLAQHAMRTDDAALAREARDALARESPAHPAIHALDDHLEARRLSARGEAEAQLLAAEGLAPSERRRMAEDLLAQYPRSAVGARVLRAIAAEETAARIDALLARAEEHAPADDAAAVAAWREAISLGADRSAFAARLEAAEERLRRDRIARAVEEIAAMFTRGEAEAALVRALEAETGVVEALRARLEVEPLEALARAEQIARAAPSARAKACARAALAWTEAERAIAAAAGSEARATAARLLDRHEKLLDPLAEVAALRERLAGLEESERRAAARSAIEAASEALERGELDEARRSLERVRAADLAPEPREVYGALLARVERLEHEQTFDATCERREREGQWLDVAAACEREVERIGDDSPARRSTLAERASRARIQARESYRFTVLPTRGEEWPPPLGRQSEITDAIVEMDDGVLLAVTGGGGWIVVRRIDPARSALVWSLVLRPPNGSRRAAPRGVRLDGQRLSIATSDAVVYTIDLSAMALSAAVVLAGPRDRVGPLLLVEQTHFAWQRSERESIARVFDTRTGQLRRELTLFDDLVPVCGVPLVARSAREENGYIVELFHPRGTRSGGKIDVPGLLLAASSDDGVVHFLVERVAQGRNARSLVRADLATGKSAVVAALEPDEARQGSYSVSSDVVHFVSEHPELSAVEAYAPDEQGRVALRWRVLLGGARLAGGSPAWVFVTTHRSQRCHPLTLTQSGLDRDAAPILRLGLGPLATGPVPLTRVASKAVSGAPITGPTEVMLCKAAIERFRLFPADVEPAAMSLARLAGVKGGQEWIDDVLSELEGVRPLPPTLRIWRARRALDQRRWPEAAAILDEIEPAIDEVDLAAWCHYARGLIAYARGDIALAVERWGRVAGKSAAANEARTLSVRMQLLHEEPSVPDDGHAVLLAAISEADALASAGDLDGAIAALDQHLVWRAGEPQSFGRLAAWHLERQPRTAAEWLRKLEVLAELTLLAEDPSAIVLAVPGAHWSEERLGEVHARARAWLDDARPPSL